MNAADTKSKKSFEIEARQENGRRITIFRPPNLNDYQNDVDTDREWLALVSDSGDDEASEEAMQ